MTKIKNYAREDWIVSYVTTKLTIKIVECQYKEKKQHKNQGKKQSYTH